MLFSSEVLKALLKTRALYDQWRLSEDGAEYRSAEEREWSATELRNALRSIEWDLEDLDDTVQIVTILVNPGDPPTTTTTAPPDDDGADDGDGGGDG